MATPFSNIYEKFKGLITDTTHVKYTQLQLEDLFKSYLSRSASLEFRECRKNLDDVDLINNQFNEDLSQMEEWIIAYGMTLSWIEPQIKYNRILRESFKGDSIKEDSHANLIDKLEKLFDRTVIQLDRYKSDYTYDDFKGFDA